MKETEDHFISFPITKLFPDKELPGDLYLYISGHFIKYKTKGDTIPLQKYNLFLMKKIQFLFVSIKDMENFVGQHKKLNEQEDKKLEKEVGKENLDIVKKQKQIKQDIIDILSGEPTEEAVKKVLGQTRDLVNAINGRKATQDYLAKMMTYDQGIADHSTNVAALSTFLAINLGYGQQIVLENLYNGALFHDYGKVLINPKYFENTQSTAFKHAMKKHPEFGKRELEKSNLYTNDTLKIILQHHEQYDGEGYPHKMKGSKIYELSKIVSIANVFDNYVMAYTGTEKERKEKALNELEKDKGKMFDPTLLTKSVKTMRLVMC